MIAAKVFNWPKTRAVLLSNLPVLLTGHAFISFPDAFSSEIAVPLYLIPFAILAMPIVQALVFIRVHRAVPVAESFRILGQNLGRFTWASFATFFWAMVGAAMLLLPMFYFMGKMAFAIPASVSGHAEFSARPVDASHHLTRSKVWPLALIQATFFILPLIISWKSPHWAIGFPLNVLLGAILTSFIAAAADDALGAR